MCGRFAQHSPREVLVRQFSIGTVTCEVRLNYNIAPTQEILALIRHKGRRLGKLRWGLVPSWAKDTSTAARLINARAETVAQKPSFRNAFKKRRCLIPADGFYEWKKEAQGKQPYYVTLPAQAPFAFAGLWETWKSKDGSSVYHSCTILTTEADDPLRELHHRMPVILKPEAYGRWLDPANQDTGEAEALLRGECIRDLTFYPVSDRVNSVKNNDAACIGALTDRHSQQPPKNFFSDRFEKK